VTEKATPSPDANFSFHALADTPHNKAPHRLTGVGKHQTKFLSTIPADQVGLSQADSLDPLRFSSLVPKAGRKNRSPV